MLSPAETAARLGDFQLHNGRPQDARPLLEEALRLQPGLASAQESLGFLFIQLGDRAEALRRFDQAIADDSKSFLAHYYHATLTQTDPEATDRYGQAEAGLVTALRLNPYFAPAYVALAGLYLRDDQKLERALELIRKALDLEPGSFESQMMLGSPRQIGPLRRGFDAGQPAGAERALTGRKEPGPILRREPGPDPGQDGRGARARADRRPGGDGEQGAAHSSRIATGFLYLVIPTGRPSVPTPSSRPEAETPFTSPSPMTRSGPRR